MPRLMARVGLDSVGGLNKIALDFSSHPSKGFPPYLPAFTRDEAVWLNAADQVRRGTRDENVGTWGVVIDDMVSLSIRSGTRNDVIEKINSARGREAFFVVTGQQPGAFGGPLLTLYKAWTAVATAAALERITSLPFVPLYWCGADDSDFQEIRGLSLVTKDSVPISTAIAQQAHGPGLPTGDIALEWLEQVWKNVRTFVEEFEQGSFVVDMVSQVFDGARDHGEHAAAMVVRLTRGALAVVDGRSTAIRRHAQPLIFDYVKSEAEIKKMIIAGGRRLADAGYHAQLAVTEDSGVFLLENGARKNVTEELRPVLLDVARTDVGRCSPGVAARNLVQDAALKPVAVVLGPAEIAYRAQISSLHARFGITPPIPVPRLTATFVPPAVAETVVGRDRAAIEQMLGDPEQFAQSLFDGAIPAPLREAARELEARVAEAADAYARAVDAAAPAKAAARVRARIADLRGRSGLAAASASEIGKAIAAERWPFVADLVSLIRPGGKPQERTLSALLPYLFGGAGAAQVVGDVAGLHVDELLDGRMSHIVYSSTT